LERGKAIGRRLGAIFSKPFVDTLQAARRESPGGAALYRVPLTTTRGDDRKMMLVNLAIAPLRTEGVQAGWIIVLEDVTDRANLEEQLRLSEKMAAIGLLAAGVAHEVNTPLAGISSYTQMLLQQITEADPKRKLLEKIHAQTLRASGIVNNLLNFSRTGDAQFRDVDLNRVLDDTLQLLEPQLRNARLEIVRHYGEELPAGYGNASKLQQVFMNLVLNARDAMPQGGRLTITTRLVDTSLVVDFRDTGIGIAPEHIARIYDPFFTTKEVGQGTGLGLALSYGIIQEHGGRIFVESRPNEGAHFTIKLPTAFSRQMQAASD
ncbi:MAG TPA: ATP-binding protein, partial [Blastocatellia bacterium]|nr:ATP-binding protein [Blastocatellia bacterium]